MEDYKIRFIKEYQELKIKTDKLGDILKYYEKGTLNFTPTCSYELLKAQHSIMSAYLSLLEERARLEKVDLESDI